MYSKEEAKKLRIEFWEIFGKKSSFVLKKYGKKTWIKYNTKIKGIEFKFYAGRNSAEVILELNSKNESIRLEYFEKLNSFKSILEKGIEGGLVWELIYVRETGNEVSRIFKRVEDLDFHNRDDWGAMHDFMIKNMLLLESNWEEIKDAFEENDTV